MESWIPTHYHFKVKFVQILLCSCVSLCPGYSFLGALALSNRNSNSSSLGTGLSCPHNIYLYLPHHLLKAICNLGEETGVWLKTVYAILSPHLFCSVICLPFLHLFNYLSNYRTPGTGITSSSHQSSCHSIINGVSSIKLTRLYCQISVIGMKFNGIYVPW